MYLRVMTRPLHIRRKRERERERERDKERDVFFHGKRRDLLSVKTIL